MRTSFPYAGIYLCGLLPSRGHLVTRASFSLDTCIFTARTQHPLRRVHPLCSQRIFGKMANSKRDDDPTSTQLLTSQNANAPISSVKLDGPKTYLVWSQQCTVALKARRLFGYVAGTKKQPS